MNINKYKSHLKWGQEALTAVAQLVGHHPTKQKVTDSIPGQGTCLGCGFSASQGMYERQLIVVSLSLRCFSPSPPSLSLSLKINKIFKSK